MRPFAFREGVRRRVTGAGLAIRFRRPAHQAGDVPPWSVISTVAEGIIARRSAAASETLISKFGGFEFALADRYRFEEELGRGAMGVVYRAQDIRLGRPVAIKMLHPLLTNEQGAARFKSEIRIAAGLHHGNIIGVHESGEADGRLFYVMDYIGGETLRSRLDREKQLPVEDALRIVEQIATALQHAHDKGVVHCDVKPENIILSGDRACLMDFGLARAFGEGSSERLTASGFSVGTPHYLSPEQASAEREVGPKADQYSLACVLYEMLAGEPPFTGPTAVAIAMRHVSQDAALIRTRRKTVPWAVEAAISRAMEKVPGDRFGKVTDFGMALRDLSPAVLSQHHAGFGRKRHAWRLASLCFALVLAGALFTSHKRSQMGFGFLSGPTLDTARFFIAPTNAETAADAAILQALLRDSFRRWQDVTVASEDETTQTPADQAKHESSREERMTRAREVGAGRLISSAIQTVGTTKRVSADLLDVASGGEVRHAEATVESRDPAATRQGVNALVTSLLFDEDAWRYAGNIAGSRQKRAVDAYLLALKSLTHWNLARADTLLHRALTFDPDFGAANLASAEVQFFQSDITALSFDALFPEAWLQAALGDSASARATIEPTLGALRSISAKQFFQPVNAGMLLQCIRLEISLGADGAQMGGNLGFRRALSLINRQRQTIDVGVSKHWQ